MEPLVVLRLICLAGFMFTLLYGLYFWRRYKHLFGTDPTQQSETSGQRIYNKAQFMAMWAFTLALFGMMVLIL